MDAAADDPGRSGDQSGTGVPKLAIGISGDLERIDLPVGGERCRDGGSGVGRSGIASFGRTRKEAGVAEYPTPAALV